MKGLSYSSGTTLFLLSRHSSYIFTTLQTLLLFRGYHNQQPLPSFRDYHAQLTFLLFTAQHTLLLFLGYYTQQPLLSFRDYHAQLTFLLFTAQQTLLLFLGYYTQQPLLSFRDYHTRQPILLFILSWKSGVVIHCKHSLHSRVNKLRGLLDFSWAVKLFRHPCHQYHTTCNPSYRGYSTQNTA